VAKGTQTKNAPAAIEYRIQIWDSKPAYQHARPRWRRLSHSLSRDRKEQNVPCPADLESWRTNSVHRLHTYKTTHTPKICSNICLPVPLLVFGIHLPLNPVPSLSPFFIRWHCTSPVPFLLMGNTFFMLSIAMFISAAVKLVRAESHTIRFKNQ